MGVAAVLAGLRSTLKSGTEAYQKQRDLMNNNEMMLSVSQFYHFCQISHTHTIRLAIGSK